MKRRRAIVNADDLGWSPGVNEGILRAHREGIVTSATIATNMPAAEEAVRCLADAPRLGVGVHLNVSQGPPLSGPGMMLAEGSGVMNRTGMGVIASYVCSSRARRAIAAEFDAQVRWALDHGIQPTHLDSHRHAHAFGPIFACVARLARRYKIPFVRWYGEALSGRCWPEVPARQRCISGALNCLGRINAMISTDLRGTTGTCGIRHTGYIGREWLVRIPAALPPGVTEIMVHPGLPAGLNGTGTRLLESRRVELDALCDPAVKLSFRTRGVEMIHYGQLRKTG